MRKNNFIAIDIGCTNIKLMQVLNNCFTVYDNYKTGDDLTKKELINIILEFAKRYKRDHFDGIGIAISGITDGSKIIRTSLPALKNLSVDDLYYPLSCLNIACKKIKFINDANATTLAGTIEFPKSNLLVGITNGTGIGLGVAVNGSLLLGSNGALGEIYGNYTMTGNNSLEKIGKLVSGSKIMKSEDPNGFFNQSIIYWNSLLSQVLNFYNPDVIYFSGGGFTHNPTILVETYEFVKENCWPELTENLTFAKSRFGDFAGCHGAITLIKKELEE